MTLTIRPALATLDDWRAIDRGASVALDPAVRPAIECAADLVAEIVSRGEAVYGVNSGFGKLATVRIGHRAGRPVSGGPGATKAIEHVVYQPEPRR
jgi:histidine ammonia-lyase